MPRHPICLLLALAAVTGACNASQTRTDDAKARDQRLGERVATAMCDERGSALQIELVALAQEARARDGRSDRVWDVADATRCEESAVPLTRG